MKKAWLMGTLVIAITSCTKEQAGPATADCMKEPPAWCATVRCTPDGKPVCGCDKITYGSACEAECAGVSAFTYGACK